MTIYWNFISVCYVIWSFISNNFYFYICILKSYKVKDNYFSFLIKLLTFPYGTNSLSNPLLSTPSLSNWIRIEPALTPTLLSIWPPETGTHSRPPSSPRLITFRCLRPASTDTFNPNPAHKSPLILPFTMEGPTKAFRGCTFLVYLLLSSIS